jgi:hypothetical protein
MKYFNLSLFFYFLWRVPSLRFGSGYALQVLIRYAHCGLSAAIPHAENKVK